MPYRYRSVTKALAAAQRMANRTGRPVKVLVQNPKRRYPRYPKKLASKYIRQEFHAGHKGKQAVAIGIARARRAAKKNPVKRGWPRIDALQEAWRRRARLGRGRTQKGEGLLTASRRGIRTLPPLTKEQLRASRVPRSWFTGNPEWLTGAMPRKIESGQHMTRFFDSGRKLRAEMFEDGGAPRLLVYNPWGRPKAKAKVRKRR